MKKLDNNFVKNQLKEWSVEDYPLTQEKVKIAQELYDKTMKEDINKNKTLLEQEGLLAEIARKLSYGDTPQNIFREHSDNRHMSYFDNMLESGEAEKIIQALHNNDISTDVLKGISKSLNFDYYDKNTGIRIVQTMTDDEDSSPTVNSLDIYKDGQIIYTWSRQKEYNINNEIYQIKTPTARTKSGNRILKIIKTPQTKITYEEIKYSKLEKTRIVARDSKGRFTRKIKGI